jgi:hypothetical protein
MNKKPISKIIRLGKVKEFALSNLQEADPAYDIELGDTVEITVIGKVAKSADAGENLFSFSREFAVDPKDAFVKSVKKWEAEEKEKAEEDSRENEVEADIAKVGRRRAKVTA